MDLQHRVKIDSSSLWWFWFSFDELTWNFQK